MITELLDCSEKSLKKAADVIKSGEVAAFPTETVYGLGANAFDESAVRKIFAAKGRPADNPLIVHISDISMLKGLTSEVPELAYKLAEKFWPGPLTMIMPKSEKIPSVTSGGLSTVGIRFPSHPAARRLIELSGLPIAAPSANLSGSPSPTTARRVYEDMNGRIPVIIDGGESSVGVESTVLCFENGGVRILRPGGVTPEMLSEICRVTVDPAVTSELKPGAAAMSPGMKYKHYAPKASVEIVRGSAEKYAEYVLKSAKAGDWCLLFDTSEAVEGIPYICYGSDSREQAHRLFEALRELDVKGAKHVFARCPELKGVGLAVYNRILRAAGFNVTDLEVQA